MRDLGLNPKRKSNFVADQLMPYRPADYQGLIQEYLSVRSKSE
jgi:hypothetical protein